MVNISSYWHFNNLTEITITLLKVITLQNNSVTIFSKKVVVIIFSYTGKKAFQVNAPTWKTHQAIECGFMLFPRPNLTHTINRCEN